MVRSLDSDFFVQAADSAGAADRVHQNVDHPLDFGGGHFVLAGRALKFGDHQGDALGRHRVADHVGQRRRLAVRRVRRVRRGFLVHFLCLSARVQGPRAGCLIVNQIRLDHVLLGQRRNSPPLYRW